MFWVPTIDEITVWAVDIWIQIRPVPVLRELTKKHIGTVACSVAHLSSGPWQPLKAHFLALSSLGLSTHTGIPRFSQVLIIPPRFYETPTLVPVFIH